MLDLPEPWRQELAKYFAQYAPQFEVWAYGSRVTAEHHEGSDLDLVLIHPTKPANTPCDNLLELREALSDESNIPICVDVMDWARIPAAFHTQINRNKVKLFAPSVKCS